MEKCGQKSRDQQWISEPVQGSKDPDVDKGPECSSGQSKCVRNFCQWSGRVGCSKAQNHLRHSFLFASPHSLLLEFFPLPLPI